MIEEAPIKFVPYLKSVLWGGNKICKYKDIAQQDPKIGESWEISGVPGHESIVADGIYKGMSITELIDKFGEELLGRRIIKEYDGKFPLLIKFIDANDDLSIQVHPDDELAMTRHNCLGKTEMWYIIQADKGAKIYSGLKVAMTADDYVRRVADGTFAETLAAHDSAPEDVFFLPAGRVHAIGAGNLLAEIQESSDITYRIYDYDRKDTDGNPRQLHTELAKDAIDYTVCKEYKNQPVDPEVTDQELVKCRHFTTNRILVNGEMNSDLNHDSFTIIMCLKGAITIGQGHEPTTLTPGTTVLLPAIMHSIYLHGHGTLLTIHS